MALLNYEQDMVSLLRDIRDSGHKVKRFNAGSAAAVAIAASMSFTIALALNDAMQKTFAKIRVGAGLLGAWIYALIMLAVGLILLFVIYIYFEPFLASKFAR